MILTPQGVPFHPVVVIGLGKNLLFKSVLAHLKHYHVFSTFYNLLKIKLMLNFIAYITNNVLNKDCYFFSYCYTTEFAKLIHTQQLHLSSLYSSETLMLKLILNIQKSRKFLNDQKSQVNKNELTFRIPLRPRKIIKN